MSFETESEVQHPFSFDSEEKEYWKKQGLTCLNPEHLVGVAVRIGYKGRKRAGIVYNHLTEYRVWGIVLCKADEDDLPLVYMTAKHLADQNKVVFEQKLKENKLREALESHAE